MPSLKDKLYKDIEFNRNYKLNEILAKNEEENRLNVSIFDEDNEALENFDGSNIEVNTNHYDPDFDGESELE